MIVSHEIVISTFPGSSKMTSEDFTLVTNEVAAPSKGEMLIKVIYISIEAGQRTHLSSIADDIDDDSIHSAIPMTRPGHTVPGQGIGQVMESDLPNFPVGSYVLGWLKWGEYQLSNGTGLNGTPLQVIDTTLAPPSSFLGTMGLWGAFAYFALHEKAKIQSGETVLVSAAAGSVGMVAVQVAKLHGCRVVGIAGSDEKVEWLVKELGADAAVNYRSAPDLKSALEEVAPEGIDVYYDTVGGPSLEAAIDLMKPHGRIIAGGQTASYNGTSVGGPSNYFWLTPKRITVYGCSIVDFLGEYPSYQQTMSAWLKEGKVIDRQTIYNGIESAPSAWIDLFAGKNIGKMLVQVGQPLEGV